MAVIRKLGDRVEKEHNQFLRDSQRLEDRSATTNGITPPNLNSGIDFESLVGRATASAVKTIDNQNGWDDDVWGAILNDGPEVRTSDGFESCVCIDKLTDIESPASYNNIDDTNDRHPSATLNIIYTHTTTVVANLPQNLEYYSFSSTPTAWGKAHACFLIR